MNTELYLKAYFDGFTTAFQIANEIVNEELKAVDVESKVDSGKRSDIELVAQIQRLRSRGLI
ncbi:hypothetical protein [Paenochrobactrum pullorum]|uniref:hypothetical protein n=1 Tax=Paenochrobactrum pullorum TaxID=1324351 RepID=UPI0035BC954F